MKKLISKFTTASLCIIFVLLLTVTVKPHVALADTYGDYEYTLYDNNATITRYTGAGGSVSIPSSIDGYPVVSIGWGAFDNCASLTSVTIPNSVTKIDSKAFNNCTSLTSVTIPNSVESIQYGAFYDCVSLTSAEYQIV